MASWEEQRSVSALYNLEHFFAVLLKTTMLNDQIQDIL